MPTTHDGLLIYGANGYTGKLVARRAVERGLRPTLAGRSAEGVAAVARRLGLPSVAVSLDDGPGLDAALEGHALVIHCAGPFRYTSRPMASACLRGGVHYLDITGEIGVFEDLARHDAEARAVGVMLLPGAGFDVVPSDCLAAHLKRRLPSATRLELAFRGLGGLSRGTALTALEGLGRPGAVRRGGVIVPAPVGRPARQVDFGRGPVSVAAIPWGDVSTAYHSTGIPDITVYTAVPPALIGLMRLGGALGPLMAARPVQDVLRGLVRRRGPGPDDEARARGLSLLWGEAADDVGRRAAARLRAPEGYTLTAATAVLIAEKVLAGQWAAGFQTPARAYGPDLIMELEGVERVDL
ncbi:MAG TPA: saccharopine dehydrogenase NADP-binding domain-containing protein [Chloroflexaceae bacterium]|nr:saccharopine dehydrogenase NADP-binding domain-containing protein [Chloroflexaceae bacterium]